MRRPNNRAVSMLNRVTRVGISESTHLDKAVGVSLSAEEIANCEELAIIPLAILLETADAHDEGSSCLLALLEV